MYRLSRLLPLFALGVSALAMADDPQLFRWTDAQGTVHYSDQPPAKAVPDLTAAAMPSFPPVDAAKLAQRQAALLAEADALQQLAEAQTAQQAQAAALAREQAELQAEAQAQQAAQDAPTPEPIYISSDFVPKVYRRNLYRPASHRIGPPHAPSPHPLPAIPQGSLPLRP
ncbi:MAG TPA: DUF4124 domain-containing protein [Gammaproteobacteria bacterium]|jgi:hypothetical protein